MFKKIILITVSILLFIQSGYANDKFLMLKNDKVNVRYGPSFDYSIKFVYKKIQLPIKIIDKKENFRRIIDHKNNSGWIHISQLKKSNSVIASKDKILFKKPTSFAEPIAQIKKGRMLIIKRCENIWCKIIAEEYEGWVKINNLWGLN